MEWQEPFEDFLFAVQVALAAQTNKLRMNPEDARRFFQTLGPIDYMLNLGTVAFDIGRRSGKTSFALEYLEDCPDEVVVIVHNESATAVFKEEDVAVGRVLEVGKFRELECARWTGKPPLIIIEEPKLVYEGMPKRRLYEKLLQLGYFDFGATVLLLGREV